MPKPKSIYRCTECGHEHPKWAGRCEACGAWNSIAEEPVAALRGGRSGKNGRIRSRSAASAVSAPVRLRNVAAESLTRWRTGLPEFDFVLGGGIVPGSMILIGGEPGIGKSTLLLQAAARLEGAGRTVLGADIVVIDSIQTVYTDLLESAPGNVGQVRECAGQLMRFAKESGASVIVVGHVTKGGGIAGPKTLEHIVDTVLYFEGDAALDYRLLRTSKNRFGSVDELGVFSMTESGLVAVSNPSAVFLAGRAGGISGSAVTALMEGTRPVLVEVQALAAKSSYGTPQRVATGLDPRRLAVLLAVLERRAGSSFADLDVFVQATAGVRLSEPGADLAVAAALLSSLHNRPAPADVVFLGEIGLGGEIRPSGAAERRIAEAVRLGFPRVYSSSRSRIQVPGASLIGLDHVAQLVQALAA
jgi:DNA repair protein RadA/Sms